jgi:hypothetical protein
MRTDTAQLTPRIGTETRVDSACPRPRTRSIVARAANGQPRTYRLAPARAQQAAYHRLAAAILGLDVNHLAAELRSAREALVRAA